MVDIDFEVINKVLRDATRRRIARFLWEEGPLEYSDIMRKLNLKSTYRLNYL